MKAVQLVAYGGTDKINVNDNVARPVPQEGEVLVAVKAAAINPFDLTVMRGGAKQMAELDLPSTLGGDFAGVVESVGSAVTGFVPGQQVYGQASPLKGHGSFAEFVTVKAGQTATKPHSLDFSQSAALPLVAVSAYQALVDHTKLQAGQKILIHGGAGGIGSIAIQLAKHLGAYVATTARATEAEFVKQLGADEYIDYESQDFSQLLTDYDAVFDTVGGETNQKSYAVLKDGGAFVSMVAPPDEKLVNQKQLQYTAQFSHTTTERLTKIAELVDQGVLKVQVDKIFLLADAAEALEYQQAGHPRGKVVIEIS